MSQTFSSYTLGLQCNLLIKMHYFDASRIALQHEPTTSSMASADYVSIG